MAADTLILAQRYFALTLVVGKMLLSVHMCKRLSSSLKGQILRTELAMSTLKPYKNLAAATHGFRIFSLALDADILPKTPMLGRKKEMKQWKC